VLGAILLGIIVLFVNCSGDNKKDQRGQGGTPSSQYPTPAPASETPDSQTSFLDGVPGGNNPSLPALGDLQSQPAGGGDDGTGNGAAQPTAGGTGQNTNVTAAADGTCADQELAVVPSVVPSTVKRGATVNMSLTVKNVGSRACSRDVGAGPQELYLEKGAFKYWSSDDCSNVKGSDVRQFNPGDQRIYKVTWNGHQSNTCSANQPAGPNPPAGQFELRARLGTFVSNPIALTIVD
jgi:hypothetical protein